MHGIDTLTCLSYYMNYRLSTYVVYMYKYYRILSCLTLCWRLLNAYD
jgi:hypothetical protein